MSTYLCGFCGEQGHNRRTCGKYRAFKMSQKGVGVVEMPEQMPVAGIGPKTETLMDVWQLAERVIQESRLTLLYGPPGTGKTTAANKVPELDGTLPEILNVTLTEESPAAELRGHYVPKGSEFVWQDGPAMMAFRNGARLVLNEIDKASGDAMTFCHALLDDPGVAAITLPTGETVRPHSGFRVVATMNGVPHDLPPALRDRFAVSINIDKLHPEAVKTLPQDLRKPAKNGISFDEDRSMSLRGWIAFAHLRERIGEAEAARAVFGERAETILNTIKIGATKYGVYSADSGESGVYSAGAFEPADADDEDIPF